MMNMYQSSVAQTQRWLSAISKTSSKQADAEAELAAKLEQARSMQEIQAQQVKLSKLESEWKLHEAQMLVQLKQKQAEVDLKLEEEKTRLKLMHVEMDVKVAAACVQTYHQIEGDAVEECDNPVSVVRMTPAMNLNGQLGTAATSQCHDTFQGSRATAAIFAETIANSLTLNHLPVPEPTTFAGDPLKFVDFKVSFTTLIDQKHYPC